MNTPPQGIQLVLLHAFPLSQTMWDPQRPAMADHVELVTPDFPGFGNQPGLDEEMLSMERAALFVQQEIESRHIDHCVLGGLSMGGYVALECWRLFPERIAGMLLADTRAEPDSDEARRGRYDAMERIGAGHYEEYCDVLLRLLVSDETRRERPDVVDAVRRSMLAAQPQNAMAAILGMAERRDSIGILSSIDVPCAVVVGEHDAVTPLEAARTMADAIPDATLVVIAGAGHLSNLENPVEFNAVLAHLLERASTHASI